MNCAFVIHLLQPNNAEAYSICIMKLKGLLKNTVQTTVGWKCLDNKIPEARNLEK